jgi:hypothetical protein
VTDRRTFLHRVASGVLALPFAALAQQTTRDWRVGYLRRTSREPADIEALRLGLRELGYVEKLESTVRYLGIEVDHALEMAEQTEV